MTNNDIIALLDAASAGIAQARAALAPPAAYYGAISDRVVRPKPALPTLGPAGFAFADPTFGSKMLRVTDNVLGAGSWRVPSNAHLAAWNADSSMFCVVGEGGVVPFAFDAATMKATALALRPYSQTEPQFSRTDQTALYTVAGSQTRTLRKVVFPSGTVTDILDLDTLHLSLDVPRTYVGGIISAGNPEVVVAFFGGQSQDQHYYVLVQPASGGPGKLLNTVARANCRLHSVSVDLSGRYVLLYPTSPDLAKGIAQVIVWDTTVDTLTPITKNPGGHDSVGYGTWVNQDQGALAYDAAQWQLRSLATPGTSADLVNPVLVPEQVYMADHSSWNHAKPDAAVPIISSTYRYGSNTVPWRAWDDEILSVATGGPSTVWRFCHHRSSVNDENPANVNPYFWYEPIVNVSPDGKWALFTSNWEKTLGADPQDVGRSRQDVFLVQLR